jgi:uncharacterized OB-fold protein
VSEAPAAAGASLRAPHVLEYAYTRSVGPIVGAFLAGLRDGKLIGSKTTAGRVIVPPIEYDPDSGEDIEGLVEVGQSGVVTTWAWVHAPRPGQPLDRPFAWALIRLDGADTAMLHAVDAGDETKMSTGMRVRVRWRADRTGELHDIACFEPEDSIARAPDGAARGKAIEFTEPVLGVVSPTRLEYAFVVGEAQSRFLRALEERRFLGRRCPQCGGVFVPARNSCAMCGVPMDEEVEAGPQGTVTMFCIVNLPFYGQQITPPYACASIRLDGADVAIFHLIQEVAANEVFAGMRVEPVWEDERRPSMESVKYFRPVRDADA